MFRTLSTFRMALLGGVFLASIWSAGCIKSDPPLQATLTFKRDGSHFSGTVVRREANSITIVGSAGDTHTFLYSELTDIKYANPDKPVAVVKTDASAPSTGLSGSTDQAAQQVTTDIIQFPEGTEFPVRTSGFLDSCCVPANARSIGTMDAAIKDRNGAILVPEGANVVMTLLEVKKTDGRVSMTFELVAADFNGGHYVISSAKGTLEPGARATFNGSREGTPEAKLTGINVHLDDRAFMGFKAVTPVVFKHSQ